MLSVTHIQKLYDSQDHEHLIECLANNGTALPLALRSRLTHTASALGLGLRRLSELTYGPTSLGRGMTEALLQEQEPGGSFRGGVEMDPLSTAAAAAGLAAVVREQPADAGPRLADALDRALLALTQMQDAQGLFCHADDRTEEDRALTSAFVLFLLARVPAFREAVRFAELMTWFDERADRLDVDTTELYHMASLDDPSRLPASPALSAIAA